VADLTRSGDIDLEQAQDAVFGFLLQRSARCAVPVTREPGPLEQFPAGDQAVKLFVIDKVLFAPVHFSGTRLSCRHRHGNPDLRTSPVEFGDDRALPDP
jgi:hypothetical protein